MGDEKERGILFSAPMVLAILEDRKWQTRRTLKLPGWVKDTERAVFLLNEMANVGKHAGLAEFDDGRPIKRFTCPYGQPGDRLWVRETWARERLEDDGERIIWRADRAARWRGESDVFYLPSDYEPQRWRPAIHMPRIDSRIVRKVVSVRVERLQNITDADAEAEGVVHWAASDDGLALIKALGFAVPTRPRFLFRLLWIQINGQESWDSNPWVWVVEFERKAS